MTGLLAAAVALALVAVVAVKGVLGWGVVPMIQRVALCLIGAGLVWAGPARFLDRPSGLGDVVFLSGIALHVWAVYGPDLWRAATEEEPDDDWPYNL